MVLPLGFHSDTVTCFLNLVASNSFPFYWVDKTQEAKTLLVKEEPPSKPNNASFGLTFSKLAENNCLCYGLVYVIVDILLENE